MARLQLAALLREARERTGRSLDDLRRFLAVSAPQASRLDSGARGFRPTDVLRLAEWYGIDERVADRLLALAEESRRREWWQQIDLADSYRTYIGLEQEAQTIDEYGVSVMPGLLQTREYAQAAASVGDTIVGPMVSGDQVESAVNIRMHRQEILDRPKPPQLTAVIDEAILARGPRDPKICQAQLEHLRDAADRPGITVQVIGFEYGLHPGGNSHFILLSLGEGLPGLYYSEGLRGPLTSSAPDILDRYRRIWNELRAKALDEFSSKNRIERYIR